MNKQVCKRCMATTNRFKPLLDRDAFKRELPPVPWNKEDFYRWERGFVSCPIGRRHTSFFSKNVDDAPPPDHCQFKLEHAIMSAKGTITPKNKDNVP